MKNSSRRGRVDKIFGCKSALRWRTKFSIIYVLFCGEIYRRRRKKEKREWFWYWISKYSHQFELIVCVDLRQNTQGKKLFTARKRRHRVQRNKTEREKKESDSFFIPFDVFSPHNIFDVPVGVKQKMRKKDKLKNLH